MGSFNVNVKNSVNSISSQKLLEGMKINFMDQLDLAISISYLEKCGSGHVCVGVVAELTSELVVGGARRLCRCSS